jgi:hypothetical protein
MANDEQEATEDGPSDEEIRRRLAWCAITDDDLVRVRQLATWADDLAGPIIDSFYDHTRTKSSMRRAWSTRRRRRSSERSMRAR